MCKILSISLLTFSLLSFSAFAGCNNLSTLTLGVGQVQHITLVRTDTCAPVSPVGATVTTPAHSTVVPDSGTNPTGWTVTGDTPGGDTVSFTPGGNYSTFFITVIVSAIPSGVIAQ